MEEFFHRFASGASRIVGSPWSFLVAVLVIAFWALSGPVFHFSDTWQLVINTSTTIVTFLTVFLIQNTQNRDAQAIHLKLDELLRGVKGARNRLIDLENLSEAELRDLRSEFERLHLQACDEEAALAKQLADGLKASPPPAPIDDED